MQDGDNGLKASRVGSSTSALGSSLSLPSHLWQPYYCLPPYTPNYAFTLSLHYCNMALSLEPQHYSRFRSSEAKIPTLGMALSLEPQHYPRSRSSPKSAPWDGGRDTVHIHKMTLPLERDAQASKIHEWETRMGGLGLGSGLAIKNTRMGDANGGAGAGLGPS